MCDLVEELVSPRKAAHLAACLDEASQFPTDEWSRYGLVPEAFPEMDLDDVDCSARLLGYDLSFPFIIGAMTGGTPAGGRPWNHELAELAQRQRVGLSLGSMRALVENPAFLEQFDVRSIAHDVPLIGNAAAWQLRSEEFRRSLSAVVERLSLDAIFVHVNGPQELCQDGGDRSFRGALDALEQFSRESPVPVLLKDVGFGLTTSHVERLLSMPLLGIDVGGTGGTHFVRVEQLASGTMSSSPLCAALKEWGTPTPRLVADWHGALLSASPCPPLLIASGGVNSPGRMALAFAMGADFVSAARPILVQLHAGGIEAASHWLEEAREVLRHICLLCGASTPQRLKGAYRRL